MYVKLEKLQGYQQRMRLYIESFLNLTIPRLNKALHMICFYGLFNDSAKRETSLQLQGIINIRENSDNFRDVTLFVGNNPEVTKPP